MTEKPNYKKYLTATNIFMLVIIIFYLLDRYLPFPEGYNGFKTENEEVTTFDYIFGFCGGLLTNYMGFGGVVGSQLYRRITNMLLHGHLLHIIANLVGLYYVGNYTEKRFGWWMTYILFFLVGFLESFITDPLFLLMVPAKAEEQAVLVTVGSSSGIFGLMGVSLAAIFFDIKSFKKIGKPTIIISAVYGVLTTYTISFGWTTVCHNVSLILGLVIGTLLILPFYLLKKGKFSNKN